MQPKKKYAKSHLFRGHRVEHVYLPIEGESELIAGGRRHDPRLWIPQIANIGKRVSLYPLLLDGTIVTFFHAVAAAINVLVVHVRIKRPSVGGRYQLGLAGACGGRMGRGRLPNEASRIQIRRLAGFLTHASFVLVELHKA